MFARVFVGGLRVASVISDGRQVPGRRSFGERHAQTAIRVDMMEFQVLRPQPWIHPRNLFLFDELTEQPAFGHPIDFPHQRLGIFGQGGKAFVPDLQDDIGFGVAPFKFVRRGFAIFEQKIDRADGTAIGQRRKPGAIGLMGHAAEAHDRICQNDFRHVVHFEQIEHQRSRSNFQQQVGWQHAGIAVEEMESAIFASVSQWFIAGIDDGAIELHPFEKIVVDVIRALADLKMAVRPCRADSPRSSAPGVAPTRPAPT